MRNVLKESKITYSAFQSPEKDLKTFETMKESPI